MNPLNSELSASTALALSIPARVFTRAGVELDPRLDVWEWTDGVFQPRIDFAYYKGGYERHVPSLKLALIPYLKGHSSAHVTNLESAYRYFVDSTGSCPEEGFKPAHLSNFAAKLLTKDGWRLGTLNGLIQKWVDLGLPGMDPGCAAYLKDRRKPGNKKGEAVTTRNPVRGPFNEVEVQALYSAVNAGYGRGHIPLWSLVLCRLLFACGGRISQFASLKALDFNLTTKVLRLPQVKTGAEHSRVSFLDFEIAPQTSRLLEDYINDLRSDGFANDCPLFPERLVMVRPPVDNVRAPSDLFYGHCLPNTLSRRFRLWMEEVCPPTARLDYAQLPVMPQRFRYTFGTRLVEEGASMAVVANRLGHVDLQNAGVYFSASPKVVENIDKAMGPLLAPLARAFQGNLVQDEANSTQKGAPGSRIIDFRVSANPVGGCSQCAQNCGFNKPVSCYTCYRFEPFLDAPHEEVLERLTKERERWSGDARMASINDQSIRAVQEVIVLCKLVREQRSGREGGSA